MQVGNYQRVTRRRRTPIGSSELWLSNDHLLLVMRHWWTERYQRFRLGEISSIVAIERPSLRGIQLLGLAATVTLWVLAIFVSRNIAIRILLGGPLSVALVWQLVDLLRGPYCRVELRTAVSSVHLTPLSRMRAAAEFIQTVTPLIEAVQGQWQPSPPPLEQPEWTMGAPAGSTAPPALPHRSPHRSDLLEWILFGATVLLGIFGLVSSEFRIVPEIASFVWTLALLPVVLGGLVALAREGAAIRLLAAFAAVTAATYGGASFVRYISAVTLAVKAGIDPQTSAARDMNQQGWFTGSLGLVLVAVGLAGLFVLAQHYFAARRRTEPI